MDLDRRITAVPRSPRATSPSIIKRFDTPERVLALDKGRLELITVGGRTIGKGSFWPGWKWSHSATAPARPGEPPPEHVGVVLSGRVKMRVEKDREFELTPGDFFHIASEYDSWVVGYRPCEVLYLSGIDALVDRVNRE
ncbi:MAG TPA: hypothetical protein VFK78_01600 [Gemmatimonadales bacterium]|nr:hypothetical protein [Gemmatimonadales bacterium]